MSNFMKALFILGAVLTIGGSLLPWRQEGDFVSYWTYGFQIYPSIKDNGGLLIVLISIIIIMLIFRPLYFIEKPIIWAIALGAALVVDSALHIGKLLIDRIKLSGVVGAPLPQVGLLMASIGSIILLITGVLHYIKRSK